MQEVINNLIESRVIFQEESGIIKVNYDLLFNKKFIIWFSQQFRDYFISRNLVNRIDYVVYDHSSRVLFFNMFDLLDSVELVDNFFSIKEGTALIARPIIGEANIQQVLALCENLPVNKILYTTLYLGGISPSDMSLLAMHDTRFIYQYDISRQIQEIFSNGSKETNKKEE